MAALSLLGLLFGVAPAIALHGPDADPAFGLHELDVAFTDSEGHTDMRAGSHPYAWTTNLAANVEERETEVAGTPVMVDFPVEETKDIVFELPPGLVGDPFAVPRCTMTDFLAGGSSACPDGTALGVVQPLYGFGGPSFNDKLPIYNLTPPPGVALRFGFVASEVPVVVDAGIVPHPPYNAYAAAINIPQGANFYATELTLWGNPASAEHDAERDICVLTGAADECSAGISERAFFTLPRRCDGPLETTVETRSWPNQGTWLEYSLETHDDAEPPVPTGPGDCAKTIAGFSPEIGAQPTTDRAEAPTGLAFTLDVKDPGLRNPDGIAQSDIRRAVVTLPEGMTINPSQAEGLLGCAPGQFDREAVDSAPGAGCPEASKIGSVEVETPLLEGEILRGSLFVAEPHDNPFDSLLALYMTVKSAKYGINVGLAGRVEPDPVTGQIVTTFDDLPQLPFSHFRLRFREGGRSPLITPPTCGTHETEANFTPWANPALTHSTASSFVVTSGVGGGPCPAGGVQPFEPGFEAGTVNNNAGAYSPFAMRLTRRDGDQDLTRFDATLPPGVVAKLAGVSRCPDAAIAQIEQKTGKQELASPSCPASSKVGSVWAGAGVGSQLTYVQGSVYLAGPFGGAPLSVVGVVPAVAGPFDVGVVTTRQALVVDPRTARVRVDGALSEPIPHILAGIPLRVRDIQVRVDRPEFTLNPTSCDPYATTARLWGGGANLFSALDDAPVDRSARFQAATCARLGFDPALRITLRGGTKRGGHPALRALLRPKRGDANLETTVVRLPRSAFLDQGHIRTICTRVQFAADACPEGSVYGHVRAFSPLLEEPLEGPAYLRSSDNELPDLVFDLHGLIDIESSARIDSIEGGIRATFDGIPDAPLSRVLVDMRGGRRGLIVNSRDLCERKSRARVRMDAHNGDTTALRPLVRARCGGQRAGGRTDRKGDRT